MIENLEPNQIFVFGSNLAGQHVAGAALQAYEKFGAEYGIGTGLQGQSYGIPTMDGYVALLRYAKQFIDFARHYPEFEFLLTPIGQGIAGYDRSAIEPIFYGLPENVTKVGW